MSATSGPLLEAEQIRQLLVELGDRMDARGMSARVFLVGGAAMALAFNTRRVTRDLDAVFEPKTIVYAEAAAIATGRGIPDDWLNDAVKAFLPDKVQPEAGAYFEAPGIAVEVASADYLFAMKACAARGEADTEDLRFLAAHLGLLTAGDALDLVERYFSPHRLRPTTQLLLDDLFTSPPG